MWDNMKKYLLLSFGALLVSVGVHFFKFPNHFSTGGVSGLAVIFGSLSTSLSPGTFMLLINGLFLIVGFLLVGKSFGIQTIYCSILYSLLIKLFETHFPLESPLTDEPFLELMFSVILPAIGSAILFNNNASTGGTDIAAMILKRFTPWNIGKTLLVSDVLIALTTVFVFDIKTGMFSVLGLLMKSIIVDSVIDSINRKKSMTVITEKPELIGKYINNELKRGATIWKAHGSFTQREKYVILTALNATQAQVLRNYIKQVDTQAFISITNTSEIFGKGFLRV
jgi:uncharacterized membrane-anchored protein YitT (DUF2179 family)